jgi:hypothetical protein
MTSPGAAWEPWHPAVLAERLAGVGVPWCVAGGWAIDLFLGTPTRPHDDLEIAVPAARFPEVAARFPELEFYAVGGGTIVAATAETLRDTHQTWALDPAARVWRFDVFREPHDGDADTWIYRRDDRIRRPYADVIHEDRAGDIPYLAPEIVLLFKAKSPREKDEADLRAVLPHLSKDRRRWLTEALKLAYGEHPWRSAVSTDVM